MEEECEKARAKYKDLNETQVWFFGENGDERSEEHERKVEEVGLNL